MSDTNTNASAFPLATDGGHFSEGMTLRDYFAAKAMQGDINRSGYYGRDDLTLRQAENAYMMADAMIQARNAK